MNQATAPSPDIDRTPSNAWTNAIIAGLIGGGVGTALKSFLEIVSPPRFPYQPSPLGKGIGVISVMLTGHDLPEPLHAPVENLVHLVFGTATGVIYALFAEEFNWVTIGYGAAFGVVFWVGFHEILTPLLGWSGWPNVLSFREQINELISHIFYGVALELTRRVIVKKLRQA